MAKQIYPCFWFDSKAKDAATFYCSVFKNSKIITENPIVVLFELNGNKIMGLNGGPIYSVNPSISLFVSCESINETNEIWDKLIEEGKVMMPIDKYEWSERYGWLQDKFGITWQIMITNTPGEKQKITPSFLFTNKQFGKAGEAIKFYTSVFENSSTDSLINYPKEDCNAGKVMYSEFNLNRYPLIAMDGPGVHEYCFNEGVSFVVNCDTQEEIDNYWNKLTEGGRESMCGWLEDRYGVSWQIVPTILEKLMSDPEKGPRVIQAFLQMKKFDIHKLLKA